MTTVTLIHNPRCSKSRQALALLEEAGIEPNVRLYLQEPLTAEELHGLLQKLAIAAKDLVRQKETLFKELGLDSADEAELLKAMAEHPKLIERPIAITDQRAIIGRPPELVLELIN